MGDNIEDANLYIHEIKVDSASMLKRIRTAPQVEHIELEKDLIM